MNSRILVNHKNLSEVLAVCGLPILAECMDSPVTKCRFTETKTVVCNDNVFRSMAFEFEHPDWKNLLQRIAVLDVVRVDGRRTVRLAVPPLGEVRIIAITDHQFGKMEVFYGKKPREPEQPPLQIMLF